MSSLENQCVIETPAAKAASSNPSPRDAVVAIPPPLVDPPVHVNAGTEPTCIVAEAKNCPHQPPCSIALVGSTSDAETLLVSLWGTPSDFHILGVLDRSLDFRHIDVPSVRDAVALAAEAADDGLDVFFACAEFQRPGSRKAEDARCARAFWMDIDCGVDKATVNKGYADSVEAQAAVIAFCDAAKLPRPTHLVASGRGLHVYWWVSGPVLRDVWKVYASRLKAVASMHGLLCDPSRTGDIASVLRVPGTLNYKYTPPLPVRLLSASTTPIDVEAMLAALEAEHARLAIGAARSASSLQALDLAKLSSALRILDPDCDEPTWKLRRLAPLAHAAREHPHVAADLEELARSWSSGALRGRPSQSWTTPGKNSGRSGFEIFSETWSRLMESDFSGEKVTVSSVYYDAKKVGWREGSDADRTPPIQTHHGYASDLVKRLTVGDYPPVAHSGRLFVVDAAAQIWVPKPQDDLVKLVSESYDGQKGCTRRNDYQAIAAHATSLMEAPQFFERAPAGVACVRSFYQVDRGAIQITPLTPSHRQRVLLPFEPSPQATPLFGKFLHDTFKSAQPSEAEEQIQLVQEIAGATMLGVMPLYQKAVLFYDPYGRAGKGTLESILRRLVPEPFVTAVSPFNWDKEYFLATLANSRLNVVGELPADRFLPAAAFKSVLGGDLLTGRNPAQVPFTFRNEAAHIFMSNHLIGTRDQSEALFARWLIVEFPNSRLKSGEPLDPRLATTIVEEELPGIAHWALAGAQRLLQAGRFSASTVHERLMNKWRRGSSSLEEFIAECCDLAPEAKARRSLFYQAYKTWCSDNGRKPYAKATVKGLLEHNISLGISLASLDGYEIFRGVKFKEEFELDLTL